MKLEGIHHVTAITGDAPRNVDFYTRVLGLRLVKKTVNQDDPTVYHLFYADERGSPGADLTFFEYPGARVGQHGAGMVHTVVFRVASQQAVDFWAQRIAAEGIAPDEGTGFVRFSDPEGIGLEVRHVETGDEPLTAEHPEIPAELALQGFDGVRAYAIEPEASRQFLQDTLGFAAQQGSEWEIRGDKRGSWYAYDPSPPERGFGGAGTVHHVAWASTMDDHEAWRERVARTGAHPTPVIDRFYFRSIYFREPSGVLFEIATIGPGFTVDEPLESLGEHLSLPPNFEHLREKLETVLTPLPETRPARAAVMSYALGLGRGRPRPAGIIALSGFIPTVEGFELDLEPPLPPVAIGHGTVDLVISVEFGRQAKALLEGAGADVLYRESPMPHTIDPRFAGELVPWLRSAVPTDAKMPM